MTTMDPEILERAGRLVGARPVSVERVAGGYTHAGRWRLSSERGSVFVKHATDQATAGWLRAEWNVYQHIRAPWLAGVLAWEDGPLPILVLEDLSGARWPPPWAPGDVARVREVMASVAATPPPPGLARVADGPELFRGWSRVARDPAPLLGLGLVEPDWLERHLPTLMAAEQAAPLDGDQLLHLDLRSDNLCFAGERVVIVDWNWAQLGNPELDIAFWSASLWAEGGPPPWELLPGRPELAAAVSGFFASVAGLPDLPRAPRVRAIQRAQLARALPWVRQALGLG